MICGIADVYDAMRSQRKYQQSFRAIACSKSSSATTPQFDQHLVRRFAQLVGIYPAGNRSASHRELAVVTAIYALIRTPQSSCRD